MDIRTDVKTIGNQQNTQAKEVQPKKKVAAQNNEPPKAKAQAVADKVSISARGVEAQKENENVKGSTKEAPKQRS